MKQRSIGLCILLSIVTCGIYGLYWFVCLTDDTNEASGETDLAGGGMALLLTLVTCGIYGWYWAYKMGEKVDIIKSRGGASSGSGGILFIVLQFFGLGIINYALAQDAINKYGGSNGGGYGGYNQNMGQQYGGYNQNMNQQYGGYNQNMNQQYGGYQQNPYGGQTTNPYSTGNVTGGTVGAGQNDSATNNPYGGQ